MRSLIFSLLLFLCGGSLSAQIVQQVVATSTSGGAATPASYINSGSCAGVAGGASCTITPGTAIPSGSVIIGLLAASSTGRVSSISDSNSDSSTCGTQTAETTDGFTLRFCRMTAGASVTTVTCTITNPSGGGTDCGIAWYSPGSLAGTQDQTTAQDQPNTHTWTSGNTATLTGSNDLVVGGWISNASTSTYSDGGTQRISFSCSIANATTCAIEDRNVTGTTAVAASGTWNSTNYGVAGVMAIK